MDAQPLVAGGFQTNTPEHAVLIVLLLAGAVVLGRVGVRQRVSPAQARFRRAFAILIPVLTVPMQVLQLLPGEFNLGTSLPLQVCDLSWMVAVYALWTRDGRAIALLYFWALILDTQAVVTPSLGQTFPDPRYFMFWGMHFLSIWAAVYLVCLAGGPTWRGYRRALLFTAVWGGIALAFNAVAGTNYGYVSRKPDTASLLDVLGPWPAYLLAEVAILAAVWALMTIPWVRAGRTAPERPSAGDPPSRHGHRRAIPPGRSAGTPPPPGADQHAARDDGSQAGSQQHR